MFDAVNQFAGQLPADTKKTLSQVFLFLLACTEDKTLNMDRVASMMSKLTDGEMRFDLPE